MLIAHLRTGLVAFSLALLIPAVAGADSNWPGWRGPQNNGLSTETGLPVEWSSKSVAWKTSLRGLGHSSPIIWGDRIFLTTALDRGAERVVMCLDRHNGRIVWEKTAWTGTPERSHGMNGWASASCTTDGKHVYAFFGKGGGLFCYTLDGDLVWKKELGEFVSPWGTSASPLLAGDVLVQNCDADQNAYIIGVNKRTGETIWKTPRDNNRGWSSPILMKHDGRNIVVVNGHTGARAYEPHTGKNLWFCKSFKGRGSPTVVPGDGGLVHVVCGLSGDCYTVRLGGSGDVTETHMAWHAPRRGGRDLPSPIRVGKYLLISSKSGVLTCYNAASGKNLWTQRLDGNFSAAPVSFQGLVFINNEAGETYVIQPGEKANVVARNKIDSAGDELFRASITPSDGQLFIRSDQVLYCIGKRKAARSE